jgi:hypothetical protein
VYQSPNAAPASYTILNFEVDDIDEAIDAHLARAACASSAKPGSTDDIESWQPFSQVRPPFCLPGGCTYQVQPSTAPIRALTCLNTDKPEKASVDGS